MKRVVAMGLRARLVISFVIVAVLPLALSGFFYFQKARTSLEEAEFKKLQLLWDSKRHELVSWFGGKVTDLVFLSRTVGIRSAVELLTREGADADQVRWDTQALSAILGAYLEVNSVEQGLEDIALIDAKKGTVVFTQKALSDRGADLTSGTLKATSLGRVWEAVIRNRKPFVSDFSLYQPTGTLCAAIGVPVFRLRSEELIGVLAVRINANEMNDILSMGEESGKTAAAYVVGGDGLMRSQSRFEKEATLLAKKVDTEPVRQALEGKKGRFIGKGYQGERGISYAGLVGMNNHKDFGTDFDWVMVMEVGEAEAFSPVMSMAYWSIGVTLVASVLVALIAFFLARGIARPITAMAAVAREVSQGNLNVEILELKRNDEVGALAESFRQMAENLRSQITRLIEGASILGTEAHEISAAAARMSSSIAQTSAAVAETSTTVEELKQAAKLSSEKSRTVAEAAQRAVGVSELGRKATEETVARMSLISDQIESVGETVVKLREQSQAIENIIATVQDLADQSNLLAVNASIEAARAGEQGKGFAVVAHEIKSLAEQSREATEQVRTILADTQKWVNSVVKATEEGARAVHAGVGQSVKAGESLETLSHSVLESSQAASLIQATSEQQAAGVDQVSVAMASIDQAVREIASGSDQLRESVARLEYLGKNIKELVDQYRV
jgi:methyl-accepting chemotaxis protein